VKMTKKWLSRDLRKVESLNRYQVVFRTTYLTDVTRSIIVPDEITAARVAREQWSADKVKSITLAEEGIFA
jgi:hypothetical protein